VLVGSADYTISAQLQCVPHEIRGEFRSMQKIYIGGMPRGRQTAANHGRAARCAGR